MKRWLMKLLLVFGIGVLAFALFVTGIVVDMSLPENAAVSDCIIIPGCKVTNTTPSLSLQSRLDCALRLYNEGFAKTIIVTGGQGVTGTITEAQAMRDYLMDNGVPKNAILLDEDSYSTAENMNNAKLLMDEHGFTSAIIATSDFHAARAMAIAKSAGIQKVTCGKARFTWYLKWVSVVREVPGWGKYILNTLGIMVG